jgi:hypothetical protein
MEIGWNMSQLIIGSVGWDIIDNFSNKVALKRNREVTIFPDALYYIQ